MGVKTTYYANKILDHTYGGAAFAQPTTYAGLFTTTPTLPAGTGGVEVTGGSYARVAIPWSAAASASKSNSGAVTFPTATANWGQVLAMGFFDALAGGNLLEVALINPNGTPAGLAVNNGSSPKFLAGNLIVTDS